MSRKTPPEWPLPVGTRVHNLATFLDGVITAHGLLGPFAAYQVTTSAGTKHTVTADFVFAWGDGPGSLELSPGERWALSAGRIAEGHVKEVCGKTYVLRDGRFEGGSR
ncbi:MAG: hypothetical protein SFU83_23555 [Meiothermus sp.]|nr:hypothetical protein [Meiothermus sp.]